MKFSLYRLGILAGALFLASAAQAKEPMFDGNFRGTQGAESFTVRFVTANVPGSMLRIAACSLPSCAQSSTQSAYCVQEGRACRYLRDLVRSDLRIVHGEGTGRWLATYGFVDEWGVLLPVGSLEVGTFGENPLWRFPGSSRAYPLVRDADA